MKICKKCKINKDLTEFHFHKLTKDKKTSSCKSCVSFANKEYRKKNQEKLKAYESSRKDDPKRVLANKSYNKRSEVKKIYNIKRLMWKKNNIEKKRAHESVLSALKSGKLTRKPCEVCGEFKVDAHHSDYSQRLNINWLCRKHHIEWHKTYGSVI